VSPIQAGRLVLLKEITGVPCESHKKTLNTFCGKNTESLNITDGGTYNCHGALAGGELGIWGLVKHHQSS